jgi:hypothetical protein
MQVGELASTGERGREEVTMGEKRDDVGCVRRNTD